MGVDEPISEEGSQSPIDLTPFASRVGGILLRRARGTNIAWVHLRVMPLVRIASYVVGAVLFYLLFTKFFSQAAHGTSGAGNVSGFATNITIVFSIICALTPTGLIIKELVLVRRQGGLASTICEWNDHSRELHLLSGRIRFAQIQWVRRQIQGLFSDSASSNALGLHCVSVGVRTGKDSRGAIQTCYLVAGSIGITSFYQWLNALPKANS